MIYRFLVSNLNLVASLAVASIVAEWRLGEFQTLHPIGTPIAYWVPCDNVIQELDLTWNLKKNECQYFNNWLNNVEDLHLWLAAYNQESNPRASRGFQALSPPWLSWKALVQGMAGPTSWEPSAWVERLQTRGCDVCWTLKRHSTLFKKHILPRESRERV